MIHGEQYEAELQGVALSLRSKVQELESEIAPLQEQLGRLRVQLEFVERALHAGSDTAPESHVQSPDRVLPKAAIADRIVEILGEAKKPLHVTEVMNRYVAKGWTVPGQGKESNLLVYMVRDSRISRVSKGTYGLTPDVASPNTQSKPKTRRRRRRKA